MRIFRVALAMSTLTLLAFAWSNVAILNAEAPRPNILFCISDDQSYMHTGANGDPVVETPAFDRVAREGLRFTQAFCNAPIRRILLGLPYEVAR